MRHELSELVASDPAAPAEVDQGSGADLGVAGDVVPARRARRSGVQQGAPEHVDLVLEGQLRLLAAQQRREGGLEGDFGDAVDLAFERDLGLDAVGGGPEPRVVLGEMDLPVLLESWGRRDDPGVGALPVVHSRLGGAGRSASTAGSRTRSASGAEVGRAVTWRSFGVVVSCRRSAGEELDGDGGELFVELEDAAVAGVGVDDQFGAADAPVQVARRGPSGPCGRGRRWR